MPRIDASRVQPRGIGGASPVPSTQVRIGDLGLSAVSGELQRRASIIEQKEAEQRQAEDALAVTEAVNEARRGWSSWLDEASQDEDGTGPGFAQDFGRRVKLDQSERLNGLDPRIRTEVARRLSSLSTEYGLAAHDVEMSRRRAFVLNGVRDTINGAANDIQTDPTQWPGAIEGLETLIEAVPAARRDEVAREARELYAGAYVTGLNRADPWALREQLEAGELNDVLTPQQLSSAVSANRAEIDRREREAAAAEAEAERRRAREQANAYMRMRVEQAEGGLDRAAIDEALGQGQIDIDQWSSLAVIDAAEQNRRRQEAAERDLILSGGVLDPTDPDHRDAVEGVWREMLRDAGGEAQFAADPAAFRADLVGFTQQFGVVPESGVTALQALAANGSVEQQASALDAIAAIAGVREAAASAAFSNRTIADAVMYQGFARAGLEPGQAMARVQASREGVDDGHRRARSREAGDWLDDNLDATQLLAEFDATPRLPGGRPEYAGSEAAYAAEQDFRQLFTSYYVEHGDADVARRQAVGVMRRAWGRSDVTGRNRLMRYPPERFYSVPGRSNEWMQAQLGAAVADLAGGAAVEEENTFADRVREASRAAWPGAIGLMDMVSGALNERGISDIQLVSDAQTAREAQNGLPPSYRVTWRDASGIIHAGPSRWTFDSSAVRGEVQRENEARISEARQARAQRMADLPFEQLDLLRSRADDAVGGSAGFGPTAGLHGEFSAADRDDLLAVIARREAELGADAVTAWDERQARERFNSMDLRGR